MAEAALSQDQARELRELAASGWSGIGLARRFGISPSAVSMIIRGKRYPDAGGPVRTGFATDERN